MQIKSPFRPRMTRSINRAIMIAPWLVAALSLTYLAHTWRADVRTAHQTQAQQVYLLQQILDNQN